MSPQTDANGFQIVGSTPSVSSSGVDANGFQLVGSTPTTSTPAPVPSLPQTSGIDENGFSIVSPNNGQTGVAPPTKHLYQDESQPWYKRAGDWLNTPLTESLFGLPETRPGAGGFERGIEHIASGLTSPLSLGLTASTFGTGGLVESAGMTALKESGQFTAEELPQIVKAAQTAVDTYKAVPEGATAIADAVKASGVDPALWNRAQSFLYDNGMTEHDLLAGNMVERGAFQVLHKVVPDLPVATTVRAAKTANSLLNAGFTLQQLESASAMSPRFFDAIKEGDHDKAWEYGTEMFASGTLGVLGASHALHSAGELFKPLIENDSFRPNDEWLAIDRANKEREAQHAVAEQEAITLDRSAREILGHTDPGFLEQVFGGSKEAKAQKDLELATVFHQIVTGGDRVKAAEWYNALSEALGREERLPVSGKVNLANGPEGGSSGGQINVESAPGSEFKEELPGYEKLSRPEKESYHEEKMKVVEDALREAGFRVLSRDTGHGYWNDVSNPVSGLRVAGGQDTIEAAAKLVHRVLGDQTSIGYTVPHGPAEPTIGNETEFNLGRPLTPEEVRAVGRNLESAGISAYPEASDPQRLRIINYANEQGHENYHEEITKLVQEALPNEKLSPVINRTTSNLVDQGTPSPIADKARTVIEELNRKYGITPESTPKIGQPIEPPSREGTKVVHSNDAGEVRVGEDGRPVVWLNPEAFEVYSKIVHPSVKFSGVSYSPSEAVDAAKLLVRSGDSKPVQQVLDLFQEAQGASKQKLVTPIEKGAGIQVVAEELGHTWQRELSDIGDIDNHLKPAQWSKLRPLIPEKWNQDLDRLGYAEDPVTRVAETAMQFMSGKAKGFIPDTDIARFLDAYYKEVEATHGADASASLHKINDIAAKHVGDIDAQRAKAESAAEDRVANQRANRESLQRMEERRQAGPTESRAGEPEGLTSRDDEFNKLSGLKLRGSMGSPGSAALVTGDNDVLIGRYHDELARQAGYKGEGDEVYKPMFRDGGVRIRTAGGAVHIDFMEPNADTWDRVYRSIASMPDANKYYVDFRPLAGSRATGFNIDAYDKDTLLYRLKDLEEGRERPTTPGSIAYFRNGMFSRDRENTAPQWYLKSNQLIDSRMSGPMPADTVLKMLENNGVKPDELKWSGISEFLRDKGKEKVTPEELRKELATGAIGVTDVTKGEGETRFGMWQLPGGTNYHELMLTIPREGMGTSMQDWNVPQGHQYGDDLADRRRVGHVRFNDRIGPNGERLLHLEELQSDWHQKGRTQGYKLPPEAAAEMESQYKALVRKNAKARDDGFAPKPEDVQRARELEDALFRSDKGVPDAPFKKTWPELLMKRMIRYAAENGYDGVSWTPGEEQAARYDLSKQIDAVHYVPVGDGTYHVDAIKDGHIVASKAGTPQQLEDFIGKDVTKKIVSGEGDPLKNTPNYRKLSGVDLKVGGEGMRGFYDKIVPDLANKLGKQFGAKVGETKIGVPPKLGHETYRYEGPEPKISEIREYILDGSHTAQLERQASDVYELMGRGKSFAEAVQEAGSPALAYDFGGKLHIEKPLSDKKVPYFPITDSMRESVMKQGQPLFSRESPNNGQLQHQIDTNVFKNQPKDYQDLVLESLRRNAVGELSDREIAASKKLRDEQDRNYEIGSSNDLLHHYIEDYMTRVYKDTNPEGRLILSDAKGGRFATNVTMAKQRVYDSNLTALLKSPKQMLLDPVNITARGRASLIKAAANRALIDNLRDKFTRASDGRPAVVLSGSGQVVSGQNGEDPSMFIDPNRVRKINIDSKVIQQLSASGDLDRYLENGTIRDITPYVRPNNIGAAIDRLEEQAGRSTPIPDEYGQNPLRTKIMLLKSMQTNGDFSGLKQFNDSLEKRYAWDPQDYISLSNNAMKGWNFITNSPDGTPVYVRSDIKVHPEFAEYLQNRLGLKESDISKSAVGKALLGAGTRLKQTLLSLSPFHMVQEALRGIMVGVNPFHITGPDILTGERIDPTDPNSPTIIRKAVEHGFTTGTDYRALQENSEGLSSGGGILDKIPGVGKVIGNSLNWYQDFLFKRYIPALKARSVELMYHEYQRMHPDWSVDRIAKAAALHANDTFGGINWRAMGRSATTQDWGRLMLLAPDWLESEMRSGARLFNKDEGGLGRAQVAKMTLGLWGIARVLNLVTTGNAHLEAPFGLAVKNKEGKETVFSIRTLPTDILHAASDPVGFITGRLSPTVRAGTELVTGRDQFGRKLQPSDLWVDAFRNMAPIPLQAVGQALSGTGPEIGNIGQTVKAVGGTATVYRTPAQKMAADLASSHSESGPIDPAQMARHRRILQIEDQARAGEISWPDLYKLTYATDQLHPDELKKIETNVKETKGMDPGMASLYSRASRLPAKDYLDLLDVMNNSEKAALVSLTLKVQKRYLNKAKKDETPEERQHDPVFMRLLNLTPIQKAVNQ